MPAQLKRTRRRKPPWADGSLKKEARRCAAGVIRGGMECYDRTKHLPRLLPITPDELADDSAIARRRILARLSRALRAERNRGRAGNWTYDLNRHIGLRQAYTAERAALLAANDAKSSMG